MSSNSAPTALQLEQIYSMEILNEKVVLWLLGKFLLLVSLRSSFCLFLEGLQNSFEPI